MRPLRHVRWGLLLVGCWVACVAHALAAAEVARQPASAASTAPPQESAAPTLPAGVARELTLKQMGVYGPIKLRGQDPNGTLNVAVRNDEVVTGAKLHLVYTYSPSLIYALSHLKVFLNGEVIATLPMDKEAAGQTVTRDVDLDPHLFTDFNRIGVQMIAHYTLDHCEDPYHSSLWTDISPDTSLTLTTSHIGLPNSLALLPAPFFDRRDNRTLVVPFVLPAHADLPTLRAAGVVSSWFGALAGWRGARFPVVQTPPPNAHAIAFALPNAMPDGVKLDEIKGPTVIVMANPASPPESGRKLLVLAGRDAKELQEAANALVLGQVGMSGDQAIVKSVDLGPERRPYDAPNWAPVDRPVTFKELVTDPAQLEASGFNPPPIRVDMRLPPDLFAWARHSVPLNVRYRYTAPSNYNDSVLNIGVNDQLLRSVRLRPADPSGVERQFNVPLLSGSEARGAEEIRVPVLRIGATNQFQFQFHMDSQKTGLCAAAATDSTRAAVDPDSSVDFSQFVHYTAMPNLAFFATSGFPFTRMADLADTAVVMPDTPDAHETETMLAMLGQLGRWSGLPALRVSLVPASAVDAMHNRDLLVIGTGTAGELMAKWGKGLPMLIERSENDLALREPSDRGRVSGATGRAALSVNGPTAAFVAFQSPYTKGRSVVALAANASDRLGDLLDVLGDDAKVGEVRGDLTVVRQKIVVGLTVGNTYYVGHLPWYAWLWVHISRYPALMAIAGILAGLFVALTVFWALGRLAAHRLER
ncbi:cellulose synthase subunit [Dyella jiangningensis]|uniref:cellulose biosynthesis cyclic di-GMP-binding regulatory protein BcsB n=1 Tax=Dyella sp. AtDHG13 TaxID=1938897 RepID=UPI00087F0F9E|nr:cellulose biosynthesis cyclic di-GMP-binding regulatory protein BcsB [Dyella sp. AtDHG13]PXV60728.1 cellulose synthase subunit [Dyella sp. AtDHG13]SDL00267.1 cellulose synthase subunit [Dyella jiangningensis]